MPELSTIVFYVFSAILLLAASRVISVKNPVHAALFLVLAFFSRQPPDARRVVGARVVERSLRSL